MKKYNGKQFYPFVVVFLLVFLTIFFILSSISKAATNAQIIATVAVGVCGNNIVEYGEDCDRAFLDGQTCISLGYDGGTLSCDTSCDFNVSECVYLEPENETGSIVFSGKAYPSSVVKILKDGQITITTASNSVGDFETTLTNLTVGSYSFAVYAYDSNGNKSKTITYAREISKDEIEEISDIIVPPTLSADDNKVKIGESITFSGQSAPSAKITIFLASDKDSWMLNTTAGSNGYYSYELDTDDYSEDDYSISAKATVNGLSSEFSKEDSFSFTECSVKKGDLNCDVRVNLIDFSILVHWFDSNNYPFGIDINADKKINLSDFSVMMYYWTG